MSRPRLPAHLLSPATRANRRGFALRTRLSPRIRIANALYATAAVPTKKAAALAVGLNPQTFYQAARMSPLVMTAAEMLQRGIEGHAIDMNLLRHKLSLRAMKKLDQLTESFDDKVALRASIDLADRGPQTAKVQRHEITAVTLNGKDVDRLSAAIAQAAALRASLEVPAGDHIVGDIDDGLKGLPPNPAELLANLVEGKGAVP